MRVATKYDAADQRKGFTCDELAEIASRHPGGSHVKSTKTKGISGRITQIEILEDLDNEDIKA
jgi:hypothetical protein